MKRRSGAGGEEGRGGSGGEREGMHELVIEGRFVHPEGIFEAEVGVDEGRISAVRKQGLSGERRVSAGAGCLIFPGFVDLHAHLREDESHEWSYKEDFLSGAKAAVHGGVTTVVDMPNTPRPATSAERVRAKKRLAEKAQGLAEILFCGGVTEENLHSGEIERMREEVVAFKIYLCETTGGLYLPANALPKALLATRGKPVVFHCEDQELVLRGRRSEAATEVSAVRSVLSAALSLNANVRAELKINIAHVSSEEAVFALRTFRNHTDAPRVFCEVTPHHLFFSEKDAARNRMLRVNPPLRSERSRRTLLNALKRGEIDFIASDHAPHTAAEKAEGAAGVPNLDTFGSFVGWLILRGVSPCRIASACAAMPASFLSLKDRGRIEEGKRADFTILDLKRMRKISSEHLYTKCGWSPFEGCEFPSVRHTIVKGEVKSEYDDVF
ncbi:MAG: dihydroorotase family protein [Candidatus Methanospirare jalkutatii]|nr:dihydroorotase family protein [Candidatus Methanospirare jalkutatii]